jgi:hypothetical protein
LVRAGSLLVVDQDHAPDAYKAGLLNRLLTQNVAVGRQALLLSATTVSGSDGGRCTTINGVCGSVSR